MDAKTVAVSVLLSSAASAGVAWMMSRGGEDCVTRIELLRVEYAAKHTASILDTVIDRLNGPPALEDR